MPDSSAGNPKNWGELAEQSRANAEKLNDPVARENMLARGGAYRRLAQRDNARSKSWSRISRISGGVW